MHPVDEVHVQVPRWAEHHAIPGRPAMRRMSGEIFGTRVCLGLHDAAGDEPLRGIMHQAPAEQILGNLDSRSVEPGTIGHDAVFYFERRAPACAAQIDIAQMRAVDPEWQRGTAGA